MAAPATTDHPCGITTIDSAFPRPGMVASHLMIEGDRAAFLDISVSHSIDALLTALDVKGIPRSNVDYVLVTHVHLDHAGAAGALLQRLPNARLIVHPRGARHMIDPQKLIAGAAAVYGEEQLQSSFGDILPVAAERVVEASDGFTLSLNGRELLCLDTPGHARHHYCVYDARSRSFFTGDTFGLSYREFDNEKGAFIFPTTTPVQFDPEGLHRSIERLISYRPRRMYLTHFGCVTSPMKLAEQMHHHVDRFVEIALEVKDAGEQRHAMLKERLGEWLLTSLQVHGCALGRERILELMAIDLELNAQGLGCWLDYIKDAA